MAAVELKKPIVRRLRATDNTRRHRPMFISIDPEGVIGVWPRRLPREEISIHHIYMVAIRTRVEAQRREKAAKKKGAR